MRLEEHPISVNIHVVSLSCFVLFQIVPQMKEIPPWIFTLVSHIVTWYASPVQLIYARSVINPGIRAHESRTGLLQGREQGIQVGRRCSWETLWRGRVSWTERKKILGIGGLIKVRNRHRRMQKKLWIISQLERNTGLNAIIDIMISSRQIVAATLALGALNGTSAHC